MAKKWTPINRIDFYCDKILGVIKEEDLSLLDLATCAARFSTIAKLFQNSFDRTKEEIEVEYHANKGRNK